MQAFCHSRNQVSFRSGVCEVEIRFGERVDQGANEMCAAHTGAVCRPNVSAQPIERHNRPIDQHHCDFVVSCRLPAVPSSQPPVREFEPSFWLALSNHARTVTNRPRYESNL